VRLVLVVALAACTRDAHPAPTRRLGDAMLEIGLRFERAGRAVAAARWELARYDITELGEVFEDDLFASKWMGNADVARLGRSFRASSIPTLGTAVGSRDRDRSAQAFAEAARACNACHVAAGMAFIEIPEAIGANVPAIEATSDSRAPR
jgi:hypothetical protein